MMKTRDESGFLESCDEGRRIALSFKNPLVVHHYDADGLSSGALVAGSLQKNGKKFRRECIKKLDSNAIDRYLSTGTREKEIIFVDLGGGNSRVNELEDVVVIDHHQTQGIEKFQVNPILFGIEGSDELSASSTAYCVFRECPDLAIVGAVGDMQWPLHGMNRKVLGWAVESGEVKVEEDLRFYGRYCRSLVQFLSYSDDPYIPGISYREEKAQELLGDLKIGNIKRTYSELEKEEKINLISALARILVNSNQLKKAEDLICESYIFPKRPRNETFEANEFSTLLNACGRHNQPDIGVRVCLGDEIAQKDATELLQHHRRMLRSGVSYASNNLQDFGRFYFLDGRGIIDEGIIGTVCGMSIRQKKPIIGISLGEHDSIKISGRAPKALVEKGLNLGDLMKKSAEHIGENCIGGGHKMAAGASIPKTRINEFLIFCGQYFKEHEYSYDNNRNA